MSSKWESNDFSIANSEQGTFHKSCLFRRVYNGVINVQKTR